MQATEQQTKALGDQKPAQAVGDHERRVETGPPEWLQPFTEGLTKGSSNSTDVSPADVVIPPPAINSSFRASFSKTYFKQVRRKVQFIHSFSRKTRIAKYADARKLRERHA